jgi:hypothetical protein
MKGEMILVNQKQLQLREGYGRNSGGILDILALSVIKEACKRRET